MQVPEAYPHDPEVFPHQHENLEDPFPKAHVPYPADADELVSEPDPLETKGGHLGRGADAPQAQTTSAPLMLHASPATCVKFHEKRAVATHGVPAACTAPQEQKAPRTTMASKRRDSCVRSLPPGL